MQLTLTTQDHSKSHHDKILSRLKQQGWKFDPVSSDDTSLTIKAHQWPANMAKAFAMNSREFVKGPGAVMGDGVKIVLWPGK